ncbi:hypothetical protein GCM10008171_16790 [Methylopila jiangsuensis]|uniref:Uncharacterized protein n=1 Tax=Methylopila jiangsuensis TaxID=586230 RepID=A0A9W6JF22_9HYPH|nr:hypothetical protein [Methylopila jiangsuensis]MDR6284062.1 hypothetical protein [Methylopila jiangsuensis]GLK76425.1 hypothetical protein GCM10008171_16790 [Methylopila jiangsuensis]
MQTRTFAALALAAALLAPGAARAEDAARLAGQIRAANFSELRAFADRHMDRLVRVDVAVLTGSRSKKAELKMDGGPGGVSVFLAEPRDPNAAPKAPGDRFELFVMKGEGVQANPPRIMGAYRVTYGGMNQGIVSYALEPAPNAPEATGKTTTLK